MRLADLLATYLAKVDAPPREGLPQTNGSRSLPPLISDWPDEWREVFEERAGIVEFEAYLSRLPAEGIAERDVRRLFGRDADDDQDGDHAHD